MAQLDLLDTYRTMVLIRKFEERVQQLSLEGHIAGSVHLCLGQEAIPVGTWRALRPQDRVLSTYRGHGWALAGGSEPSSVLAEIAQREGGLNGGRAGSAMLSDPAHGFLGENAIVGAGIPIGAGVALAASVRGEDRVVVSSIGDGAMNQGSTTEGMIFAAAKNLPIIFLCENNGWAEMTPIHTTTRTTDLAARATGLGIPSVTIDGNDPQAVFDAVRAGIDTCAEGKGPVFIECTTKRLGGHYNRDIQHYRSKEDQAEAAAADPILRLRGRLLSAGVLESELDALDAAILAEVLSVSDAVVSRPQPRAEAVLDHLYGAQEPVVEAPRDDPSHAEEMTYQRAINAALALELEARPDVLLYGEDVGYAGGIFGVSRGLQKRFGAARVFDTPIAEAAILGSAVGAAMEGMRPVVEIMWADFLYVALDQVVNQAANVRYINESRLTAPLTIRTQQGITPGSCSQHSQSVESVLAHIPGIKVGLASTAQDAYAMIRAAIADDDPTVVIESRSLYQVSGKVDLSGPVQAASGARLRRDGTDLAIISWGPMVLQAEEAAERLREDGIEAAVLDLRWVRPLDMDTVSRVVTRAGGRVVIAHEASLTGGFGAELAAIIANKHFGELPAPIERVGAPDVRIPSAPSLQQAVTPNSEWIVEAARRVLGAAAPQR